MVMACAAVAPAISFSSVPTTHVRASMWPTLAHITDAETSPSTFGICTHGTLLVATSKVGAPRQEISVEDVTGLIQEFVAESQLREGLVTVISKHTTTGITINEFEVRLASDLRRWLLEQAPPDERSDAASLVPVPARYAHNDIDARPESESEWRRCLENGDRRASTTFS